MNTSEFLALIIGVVIVPVSLSILFTRKNLTDILSSMLASPGLLYLSGILALVAGTCMIYAHNVWVADWPVIITLLGWAAAIKGVLLIMAPNFVRRYSESMLAKKSIFPIAGIVYLGLGIFLISRAVN